MAVSTFQLYLNVFELLPVELSSIAEKGHLTKPQSNKNNKLCWELPALQPESSSVTVLMFLCPQASWRILRKAGGCGSTRFSTGLETNLLGLIAPFVPVATPRHTDVTQVDGRALLDALQRILDTTRRLRRSNSRLVKDFSGKLIAGGTVNARIRKRTYEKTMTQHVRR